MNRAELLIEKTIKLYESDTGWGDSGDWTHQDFLVLSEKIQQRTGQALSYVTLKRVWGKVKYDSLPSTHTLNTLVQFLGYESWRDFRSRNGSGATSAIGVNQMERDDRLHTPERNNKVWVLKVFGLLQSRW